MCVVVLFLYSLNPLLHLCILPKKPCCCGARVWTISIDVKLAPVNFNWMRLRCDVACVDSSQFLHAKFSFGVIALQYSHGIFFKQGDPWALGWHGPTKTHPSCCANVPAAFESWWGVANPGTTMPLSTRITSGFLNSAHERIKVASHLSFCTRCFKIPSYMKTQRNNKENNRYQNTRQPNAKISGITIRKGKLSFSLQTSGPHWSHDKAVKWHPPAVFGLAETDW